MKIAETFDRILEIAGRNWLSFGMGGAAGLVVGAVLF